MKFETLPINARLLEPAEVAERFVSNDTVVGKVASQNHVIVLGPRGSGKTTVLAMMTQPAQRVWMRRFPESSPVSFLGILVRADLTWARQLRFLGRKLDDTDRRTLMLALYMNRSFMAMARYTKDLLQHASRDEQIPRSKYEAKIVDFIRAPCRLSPEVETLTDVKFELNERNQRLWEAAYANRLNAIGPEAGLRLDLFQAASSLSEALQDLDLSSRIALLLDELELVPREVRNYLREGLRDADSRVLLKLSLSPAENTVSDLVPETAGSENDDFTFVDLSYPRRTHGEKFTSALLVDLARRRGMRVTSSPQMLGRSRFEAGHSPSRGQSAYGEDSNLLNVFRTLAQADKSFAHYLARANIRLDEIGDLSELERAQSVRKIRDIVIVREADLRRKREGRLRHVPERRPGGDPFRLYAGNSSVLALLEGNPRWIVNFISFATARKPVRSIRTPDQVAALGEVLNGVRSRILATPVPVDALREVDPERGKKILDLIEMIGAYFYSSVHEGEFTGDPSLTFRCDAGVDEEIRDLVADGTAHGAFVFIPDKQATPWNPTNNGKFRLAYLMAAQFMLPPILGREVNLSTILRSTSRSRSSQPIAARELVLFTE